MTLEWPHRHPLLAAAPLGLPDGWTRSADEQGSVLVFAGHGLGLRNGSSPLHRLPLAAENGALAAGAAPFTTEDGVSGR